MRVPLHGRRVGGWVVGARLAAARGQSALKPLAKVTGWGPPAELVELAEWAAWRWARARDGRSCGTASPPGAVLALPALPRRDRPAGAARSVRGPRLLDGPRCRWCGCRRPPTVLDVVLAAAARGHALVVTPSVADARQLGARLRRAGVPVGLVPAGLGGGGPPASTVVGARAAAWAPVPGLAAVVVLDEHDEALQEERTPTWHARDVAVERARRAGVPCVLVSPCPTLAALARGRVG